MLSHSTDAIWGPVARFERQAWCKFTSTGQELSFEIDCCRLATFKKRVRGLKFTA